MNVRIGVRLGAVGAAAACAFLVACGGGGSGTPPITTQTSPTPAVTPTVAPTAYATTAPLSTTAPTIFNLGGVSNGGVNVVSSSSVTMPAVSAASNATVSLTAAVPSGVPTPSAGRMHLKHPDALGVPTTVLAYFTITLSSTVTIAQTPAFNVTFATPQSGNCYIVVYDPTSGWNGLLGPSTCGSSVTFNATALAPPLTLNANVQYVFALVTTAQTITTPTPQPTSTVAPSPTASSSASPAPAGSASPLPNVASNGGGWSPYQVATAFQFPVQSGYNGAGQTIVVIGDNPPTQADLSTFESYFQLPVTGSYTVVNVNGVNSSDTGGQGEATLDVETIRALAPGANIEFYSIVDLSDSSFLQAYNQALTDTNHPKVFSISFGGCESSYEKQTEDPVLAQGAAAGIAFTASSGDQGDECYFGPNTFNIGVNSPASDPNVIGVGGNETYNPIGNPPLTNAVAWNDTFFSSGQGATGGGVSTLFTPPPYQNGVAGRFSTTMRDVPDIAMPAVDVSIRLSGAWQQYGGTSWSAPQAAAMIAELDQYCNGLGANPITWLYTAFSRSAANFVDVTSGTNQFGTDSTYYSAGPGYDNTTGLGLPRGMPIAQSICANHTPALGRVAEAQGIAPVDRYGAARDTELRDVPNALTRATDLGARAASAPTEVTLVLRATPTMAQDESSVIASLRASGFQITRQFSNHLVIVASASASSVAAYFRTQLHDVNQGRFGTRYANVTDATLPAAIAPYVHGVILNNLITMKAM